MEELKKMSPIEAAQFISKLPVDLQNEFFENIKSFLTEDEWLAVVKYIGLIGMFSNPAKYKAMRTALCEELFGMEVPFSVKTMFDY